MGLPYSALAMLYDRLLGDPFFPLLQRNFDWLVRFFPIRLDSAADVACGTGTFVKFLCSRGIPQVTGIDRSPEMLKVALQRNCWNQARFYCQDFLSLRLPNPVDLITCNFDSLNYLLDPEQLFKAFGGFKANLNPGGWTLFDMITGNQAWQGLNPFVERRKIGDLSFFRSMFLDRLTGLQHSKVIIRSPEQVMRETHVQRVYPTSFLLKLLRDAGFTILKALDFENLEPLRWRSPRILVVARRS